MKKIIFWLIVVNIAILLFMSAFDNAVFDEDFYFIQHEKNGVYARFGKDVADDNTLDVLEYLKGKGELNNTFFNQKEIEHMQDVQKLFSSARILFFVLLATFILLLYNYFKKSRSFKDLSKIFLWSSILIFCIVGISIILSVWFDKLFYIFHLIFFTNDKWLLNPATDNLIILFPGNFFFEITKKIFVNWFINGLIFLLMSILIRKLN